MRTGTHNGVKFFLPQAEHLARAHAKFIELEPRWRSYDRAAEAVATAFSASATQLVDALHILLFDWNKRFYNSNPPDLEYQRKFALLLDRYRSELRELREKEISSFDPDDDVPLVMFVRFANLLGPVGAAKGLGLLAPRFFTLWDNPIAGAYHLYPNSGGWRDYFKLMAIRQEQCRNIAEVKPETLKTLDELDYLLFTKGLLIGDLDWLDPPSQNPR